LVNRAHKEVRSHCSLFVAYLADFGGPGRTSMDGKLL
jgi:hypothetical protein